MMVAKKIALNAWDTIIMESVKGERKARGESLDRNGWIYEVRVYISTIPKGR